MSAKILCVDDEASILIALQWNLQRQFSIDTALGGAEGLEKLEQDGPYSVVIADMQMPRMNGIEFLKRAETMAPDTVRIMLTGNADSQIAIDAVNCGHVFRFLTKPCPPDTLTAAVQAGLKQHGLIRAERELIENTLKGSIKVMTDILATVDPQSFGRAERLCDYVRQVGKSFRGASSWEVELAAMLSPIGYLVIPTDVLERSRADQGLSGPEKDMLARVPEFGAALLANIPRLEPVSRIVLYQNKSFDGSGFPYDGVAGEQIPVGARVLKILQDLLVIESSRTHRFRALDKMQQCWGRYDPSILEAVAAAFHHCLTSKAPDDSKTVAFEELRVGQVLKSDLTTTSGTLIAPAGTSISQMLLQKLRNFAQLNDLTVPIHIATT